MSTSPLDQDIQNKIQSFLAELSGLVKRSALEAVQEALAGGGAGPRRGPGRPPKVSIARGLRPRAMATRGVRGKRAKRSSEDVEAMAARVLTQIRSKQGQRLEEIGKAMRMPTKGLKLPIQKLMAAKKLKTKGRKRGTQYFTK